MTRRIVDCVLLVLLCYYSHNYHAEGAWITVSQTKAVIASTLSSVLLSTGSGPGGGMDGFLTPMRNVPMLYPHSTSLVTSVVDPAVDPTPPPANMQTPTDQDNQLVQMAFRDFREKRLESSEKEFTMSIKKWEDLQRPRDEIVSLLKTRGDVRTDFKQFKAAIEDYDRALQLMSVDGETVNAADGSFTGRARYPEYPDAFVGRALAKEGLADWSGAVSDYDKAITLWGGNAHTSATTTTTTTTTTTNKNKNNNNGPLQDLGTNPYVLVFRGNALTRLNDYEAALADYSAASDIFIDIRDIARYSDARANYALTLYQLGRTEDAVKVMTDVVRRNPGYADMHVALAADSWSRGNYIDALKEWRFTCDRIEVGCDAYKDLNWVRAIRRWPDSLATKLSQFLAREIPESLKGTPGSRLAPASSGDALNPHSS